MSFYPLLVSNIGLLDVVSSRFIIFMVFHFYKMSKKILTYQHFLHVFLEVCTFLVFYFIFCLSSSFSLFFNLPAEPILSVILFAIKSPVASATF